MVLPRNLLSGGLVQNQSSMHYTLQTDEPIFLHDWPHGPRNIQAQLLPHLCSFLWSNPLLLGDCEAIGSCAMVSFGLNSPHCQKVKTQNLVLQEHLESIGAPLNTKASRTHHGQKQTESGKPSLDRRAAHFISLSAHKPRLNQFCPEIPLMGACVCNP